MANAVDQRERLRKIRSFPELVTYLREDLDWPIAQADFEELTYEYEAEELGIDPKNAAKIRKIRRMRRLHANQPWGIFFIDFEPKRLQVVALRRILNSVVVKKRASAQSSERRYWDTEDMLFVSNYGEVGEGRQITFVHFQRKPDALAPTVNVLGWDSRDTPLHLDDVADKLEHYLAWPKDVKNADLWRKTWMQAFQLQHGEVIRTSQELATALARLARSIRDRILSTLAIESDKGPIRTLMSAFRKALVHDLKDKDFADMYAQTIAYGLLSARIANRKNPSDRLSLPVTNPFLKELMEAFLKTGERSSRRKPGIDFDELGVGDVVELLDRANLEAVVRDFGDQKPGEDPVIHFYEDFLSEYDKELKVQRGVFYTPRPVVSHIVRRAHHILQTEFGLEDGLADTATWGEMLRRRPGLKMPTRTDRPGEVNAIEPAEPFVQILDPATGTGTFVVEAIDVIHGALTKKWTREGLSRSQQEAAWNEYVPKHLLPRIHAYEMMMAPYAIAHLKVGLKLAETGYRFERPERARIYLTNALEPPLEQVPLIGFPALAHEAEAVNDIKLHKRFTVIIGNPPYSNFGQLNRIPHVLELLDAYKQGLDEKKLNLDDDFIKFTRFAESLVEATGVGILGMITNNVFVDGLTHRQMRKHLLETFDSAIVVDLHGSAQKSETAPDGGRDDNVFDIKQGVAIGIYARTGAKSESTLRTADLYGVRQVKYDALAGPLDDTILQPLVPEPPMYFFKALGTEHRVEYERGWRIPDAMPAYNSGIQTKRDSLTIHVDRASLEAVLDDFRKKPAEWLRDKYGLEEDGRDWTVPLAMADVRRGDGTIIQVQYRPFDFRWTYFTGRSKGFLAYPRDDVSRAVLKSKRGLVTMRQIAGVPDLCEVLATTVPVTDRAMASTLGTPYMFPLYMEGKANLAKPFLEALKASLGQPLPSPEQILAYVYAILHCPRYRTRYAELLRIDFPRIPLTENRALFLALAEQGEALVGLHTLTKPPAESVQYVGPAFPRIEKIGWKEDSISISTEARFSGVPKEAWEFRVGGYQVCEKWLKDRKGRTLSPSEITEYARLVAILHETSHVMATIDALVERNGGWPKAFELSASSMGPIVGQKSLFGQIVGQSKLKRR